MAKLACKDFQKTTVLAFETPLEEANRWVQEQGDDIVLLNIETVTTLNGRNESLSHLRVWFTTTKPGFRQ